MIKLRNYKVLLFNGPPRCGKDTATNFLQDKHNIKHLKLAEVLKQGTHGLYGLKNRKTEYYDLIKDKPNDDFLGLTPRQAYVKVAENYFKDIHGKDIFARLLIKKIQEQDDLVVSVSDLGFEEELDAFVETFGAENIQLFKIKREGCSFDIDSRNYVDVYDENGNPKYRNLTVCNLINNEIDIYLQQVERYADHFLTFNSKINKTV